MNTAIVGCGNICDVYIQNLQRFPWLQVVGCADLLPDRARSKAAEYGIPKYGSPSEILSDHEVELVVNLTPPAAHYQVSRAALEAGKHVYSEKPLALTREEGKSLLEIARQRGLQIGCAPDTFLGGGLQTARELLDRGVIGRPVAASAFMLCPGHEHWHPSPHFFYQPGGGPLFDMGPYYLTALVQLLGSVARATALAQTSFPERMIQSLPHRGEKIHVQVFTHVVAAVEFECGALCTLTMSFDVWAHRLPHLEIYGEKGSMALPDPNQFGGPVRVRKAQGRQWRAVPINRAYTGNSRGLGVADLAQAILKRRSPRASGDLAFHVLDVMVSIIESAETGRAVEISSRCERPSPAPTVQAFGEWD